VCRTGPSRPAMPAIRSGILAPAIVSRITTRSVANS
jgi:hypothetical protein